MNPQYFRELVRMGPTTNFTLFINNQRLSLQRLVVLTNGNSNFIISSDNYTQTLDVDCWRMSGDTNNIILTNIHNAETLQFIREL